MVMAAFFRGRWWQKTQDPPDKRVSGATQLCQEEDDGNEDPGSADEGSGRVLIRRNSRFYRSMRKKRISQETSASEQPTESETASHAPTSQSVCLSVYRPSELQVGSFSVLSGSCRDLRFT